MPFELELLFENDKDIIQAFRVIQIALEDGVKSFDISDDESKTVFREIISRSRVFVNKRVTFLSMALNAMEAGAGLIYG